MTDKPVATKSLSRRILLPLLAAGAVLVTGPVYAEHDGPRVSDPVRVNAPQALFPADNPGRNSTTIAASKDGDQVLVGFEDFQGFCGAPSNQACPPQTPTGLSGYAFSNDGGRTFIDGGSLFALGNLISAGHPSVARLPKGGGDDDDDRRDHGRGDRRDTWFFSTLLRSATNGAAGGLGIYRGAFDRSGNFTFTDGQVINSANPGDQYTREAIAAAKDGSGSAYMALANIDQICGVPGAGFGQIELWRTHDRGDTWQGPAIVSPETSVILDPNDPDCGNDGILQVAPALATGPRGEVYVVWQYGPRFFLNPNGTVGNTPTNAIAFSRSTDGGRTFSTPKEIAALNAMRNNAPVGYGQNRMNDQPRIAVAEKGRYKGRIYVTIYPAVTPVTGAANVQSLVSSQAFLLYSDDRGETWSAPVPLAPPVPATGVKRFWPTPSVRPNGDVDVVFLESQETPTGTACSVAIGTAATARRTGPASSLVDTYWVQSRDGGATFGPPVRVSQATSNWCVTPYRFSSFTFQNYGQYIGTASIKDRTLVTWPDGSSGGPVDVFYAEVKGRQPRHDGGDDD